MNKGFTLIETMAALSLLLFAVMGSSRILVSAMAWTRQAQARFRLVETLDYYKNFLSSLPLAAPELAPGAHGRRERELRVAWRVEEEGSALRRVRLAVANAGLTLRLVLYRSRFIQENRP